MWELSEMSNQGVAIVQVRIARATANLEAVLRFYHEGLGLPQIGSFTDHSGYSGVMLGLPGQGHHLEFTHKLTRGRSVPADEDDLLVLYIPEKQTIGRLVVKLGALGYFPCSPANPYWEDKGVTIADPDGWRVVLVEGAGL